METIHGRHLEMIDPSGRLLGRIWHGCQLELFDRVFFRFVFFNRFHHEVGGIIFPSLSTLNSFALRHSVIDRVGKCRREPRCESLFSNSIRTSNELIEHRVTERW